MLEIYIRKNMIPHGLRICKTPKSAYGDDFMQQWNTILSDCSVKWMQLILTQESTICVEIKQLQIDVAAYTHLKAFKDLDLKIKTNITKMESLIMETKQTKLMRDLQDYKSKSVYSWFKKEKKMYTPHFILKIPWNFNMGKKRLSSQRVNFNSTELEWSDTTSEIEENRRFTRRFTRLPESPGEWEAPKIQQKSKNYFSFHHTSTLGDLQKF